MARIKVLSTPPGNAPEWVREACVGLDFEVKPSSIGLTVADFNNAPLNGIGYEVVSDLAIALLQVKNKSASEWLHKELQRTPFSYLIFARSVCKELS